jgi:hypothetical protein
MEGLMQGRPPAAHDYELTQRALALLSAYEFGTRDDDFSDFLALVNTEDEPRKLLQAATQLAWMMMKSFENSTSNAKTDDILQWYGQAFAVRAAE